LISPLAAVLEIAPAKVLHGAVRLQVLPSSPTPETQVLVACALAGVREELKKTDAAIAANKNRNFRIGHLLVN
jgi:hypothetical protein